MDAEYYKKYEPVFGKWYITKQLGAGSYGKVFEIQRTDALDGTVYRGALKAITIPSSPEELQSVLDEDGLDRQGASSYFRETVVALNREIALMNKVKGHSNIVSYEDHDVIEHTDGIGWDILIRMELLTPISQYFKQFDTIPRQAVASTCAAHWKCARNTASSTGTSSPPTSLSRTPATSSWAISAWPARPARPPVLPPLRAP